MPDPIANAEKEVEESLDALQNTGTLQLANRMDVGSLVDPEPERDLMGDEVMDQDIFDAVITAQKQAEEAETYDADADADADVNECIDVPPSHKEALDAVSTLQKYVHSMDDPFVRQLEGVLASFGRKTRLEETHSLKDTEITMYFTTS
ncbi:hypothetical protein F5146DRAFT_938462 [Armillaria mellea]|nr:hypothetical protein F5146DRAFT_938462 [Armillaria mellea]